MTRSRPMLLTTADGARAEPSSRAELERALATLGDPGNERAKLQRSRQVWIHATQVGHDRFAAEHRDGSDAAHFASVRANLSRAEIVELFASYLEGADAWRSSIEWQPMDPTGPDRPELRRAPRRAPGSGDVGTAAAVAVLFGAVAAALLALGERDLRHSAAFLGESRSAAGTIVGYTEARGRLNRREASFPIVRVETRDGRVWTFQGRVGATGTRYPLGGRVPVRYDPAHPEDAMIDDDASLWGVGTAFVAAGAAFGAIALYILLRTGWSALRRAGSMPRRR